MKAVLIALTAIALSSTSLANAQTADSAENQNGATQESGIATKTVMPNPTELVNARTMGKKREPVVIEKKKAAKVQAINTRPTASVYGGPSLPAKTTAKRGSSEAELRRNLPGELPAGAPIPDATK